MKLSYLAAAAALVATLGACKKNPDNNGNAASELKPVQVEFAKGADVSWASEMETTRSFKTYEGRTADLYEVLAESIGMNAVRFRVWVDPWGPQKYSGKDDVVKQARRAFDKGLAVLIDFHYSDFFADPSRQTKPSAWTGADIEGYVRDHTAEVCQALKEGGVYPTWVQIGNETRAGMIWPEGNVNNPDGWKNFARYERTGYNAVKKVFPETIVMPHLNHAYRDNLWWFQRLKTEGGLFDAVALSHYPQSDNSSSTWDAMNRNANTQITALGIQLGCPVYIVELGTKADNLTLAGQILKDFMEKTTANKYCKGVFYWEPEVYNYWKPAVYSHIKEVLPGESDNEWNAYDMGCFQSDGSPSEALKVFDARN